MNTHIPTEAALAIPQPTQCAPRKLRFKHKRISQIMQELHALIYPESGQSLLMVCGPSGVGKSTLCQYLVESTNAEYHKRMEHDSGFVPAIFIEAELSGEDEFSWRVLYEDILEMLEGDIGLQRSDFGVDETTGRVVKSNRQSNSLKTLRKSVVASLKARGTRLIVIDEAAHIFANYQKRKHEKHINTLKSLANRCGAQIVLVGSYDLYDLVSLSGQIARRTHVVHFERYRQDNESDCRAFQTCLQNFQAIYQHICGTDLMQHAEALHENTLGCIGTLSELITRAMSFANEDGWSIDALRRALLTDSARLRILDEILDGETAINPGLTRNLIIPRNEARHSRSAA